MYIRRDRRLMMVVVALLAGLLVLVGCSPSNESSLVSRARVLADQTPVCVDNKREYTMRVELLNRYGREMGEIFVPAFQKECEWVATGNATSMTARIKSTSIFENVIPPQWRQVQIPNKGGIKFVTGADGLTPFAHSSVY